MKKVPKKKHKISFLLNSGLNSGFGNRCCVCGTHFEDGICCHGHIQDAVIKK